MGKADVRAWHRRLRWEWRGDGGVTGRRGALRYYLRIGQREGTVGETDEKRLETRLKTEVGKGPSQPTNVVTAR